MRLRKFGPASQVNTTSAGNQEFASVAGLSDGRYVVSWTDKSNTAGDTSDSAIRAQVFRADGSSTGDEFLVNTIARNAQFFSFTQGLDNGGFVTSWTDTSHLDGDTQGSAIRLQVFDAAGDPVGTQILVNTTTAGSQVSSTITALSGDRFLVSWSDGSATGGDKSSTAIRAQVFGSDGTAMGDEFLVNSTVRNGQSAPTVTELADGRIVISWTDASATGGDTSLHAIRGQIFSSTVSPLGDEFLINTNTFDIQSDPANAALAGGGFVVTWQDYSRAGGDTSLAAIRAQVFAADGTPSGGEILVNTTTFGGQYAPTIAGLPDGRFVVAWSDASNADGVGGADIRVQVFNSDGSRWGKEVLADTTTEGGQVSPTIAVLADGRFVLGWTEYYRDANDKSQVDIKSRIFDSRDAAVELLGSGLGDEYFGTRFNDRIEGFSGKDFLWGQQGNDRLFGGTGQDHLLGGAGRDKLFGGGGDDQLRGNRGHDRLFGGKGDDMMTGGRGGDVFVFSKGTDVVTDFKTSGDRERIDLSGVTAIGGFADLRNNYLAETAGNAVIDDGRGNTLTLNGVGISDLDPGDFIF